jgi:hypothetical protein
MLTIAVLKFKVRKAVHESSGYIETATSQLRKLAFTKKEEQFDDKLVIN